MNNYITRTGLTLIALVLALALPAKAQTIAATATNLGGANFTNLADGGTAGTHGSEIFTFTQFDTSLGTLTGVTFGLSNVTFTNGSTASVTNGAHSAGSFTNIYLNGDYDLTDSLTGTVATNEAETTFSSSPNNPGYSSGSIAAGATYTTPSTTNTTPGAASTTVLMDASTLGLFTGVGTVALDLGSYNSVSVTGTSPSTFANSFGSGTVFVTYSYIAAVPEPSQTIAWMMVLGLGLVAGRKFIRRSAVA